MDQGSRSPKTEKSDVWMTTDCDSKDEHYCCEHVTRDNRFLYAWIAFLMFLFGAFKIFAGN